MSAASQEAAAPSEAVDRSMLARARDWMADNIRERDIEGATVLGYLALFLKASPATVAAAPSEEPVAWDRERVCAAAKAANYAYQQWMPQQWIDLFIKAYEAKP